MAFKTYDYEEIIDKVISMLQTYLPAEIIAINAVKPPPIVLTDPDAYYFGFRFIDPRIDSGKTVITVGAENIEGTNFNPSVTENDVSFAITLISWEASAESLARKLLRYELVLRKVLDEHSILDEFADRPDNLKDSVVSGASWGLPEQIGNICVGSVTLRLRIKEVYSYN